jgi:aspartyl-tRNA synthetase
MLYRTHYASELGPGDEGSEVRVAGWLAAIRDHGGLLFVDLRDKSGLVQTVVPQQPPELCEKVRKISRESVVSITGRVRIRPPGTENEDHASGGIEIEIGSLDVLGPATANLPFELGQADAIREAYVVGVHPVVESRRRPRPPRPS